MITTFETVFIIWIKTVTLGMRNPHVGPEADNISENVHATG